jgi:hypothetical protein
MNGKTGQPDITIEGDEFQVGIHIYVIWDDWKDLEQIDRSEIIMRVFEVIEGKEKARKVTVAMGLTSAEAKRTSFI